MMQRRRLACGRAEARSVLPLGGGGEGCWKNLCDLGWKSYREGACCGSSLTDEFLDEFLSFPAPSRPEGNSRTPGGLPRCALRVPGASTCCWPWEGRVRAASTGAGPLCPPPLLLENSVS